MMNKRLITILSVILVLTFVAALCTTGFAAKKLVIGYATKSSSAPFWVILNNGATQAAKDLDINLVMLGPPKENDIVGQLAVIEDLINRGSKGLVIAPCDSVGVSPVVLKANKKKIPVIAVDTAIQGNGVVTSFVATDNIKAAESAAAWMGKRLKGVGNIVLINGMISQGTGKDRYEGFRDYLAKNYPQMKIVTSIAADWNEEKALKGMEDAMQANPVIDGVFVGWDGAALVAHKVLTEAGRKSKTVICGFDCYDQSLRLMKQGTFEADVAQFPYKMGYEAIKTAVMAAKGIKVPARIDTGTMLVTPDNVDEYIKDNNIKL